MQKPAKGFRTGKPLIWHGEINRSINSFGQQKKMNVIIATLLLISAAEAVRNLVGLPDEMSSRLHHLLKGTCRYIIMLIEINIAI